MTEIKEVHEQVQDLLRGWNAPPQDHSLERIVGVPVEEGDTRATSHVPMEELNRGFHDDGDDDEDTGPVGLDPRIPYDARTNAELKEELKRRELPVSGNHDDLVARLEEDDESDGSEDDDDDDED